VIKKSISEIYEGADERLLQTQSCLRKPTLNLECYNDSLFQHFFVFGCEEQQLKDLKVSSQLSSAIVSAKMLSCFPELDSPVYLPSRIAYSQPLREDHPRVYLSLRGQSAGHSREQRL